MGAVGADFAGALAFEGPGRAFGPVDDFAGFAGDFGLEGELVAFFPGAAEGADFAFELGADHEDFVFEAIEQGFAFEKGADVGSVGHGFGGTGYRLALRESSVLGGEVVRRRCCSEVLELLVWTPER